MISLLTEGADFEHSDHGPDLDCCGLIEELAEVRPGDHPGHDAGTESRPGHAIKSRDKLTPGHIRTGVKQKYEHGRRSGIHGDGCSPGRHRD